MVTYAPLGMSIFRRYGRVRVSSTYCNEPSSIDTQRVILLKKNAEKSRLARKLNSNNSERE